MSLDIGDAVREGLRRTLAPNGLVLMVVFLGVGLASTVVSQSALAGWFEFVAGLDAGRAPPRQRTPLALSIPLGAALAGWFVMLFVSEAASVVAVRTMVGERTDAIPGEYVRRNMALAVLNGVVGGVVVGVLVAVGLVFLVVPGVFLALSFLFVRQEIAVEDENFVDAMTESWDLASGSRIELFVLGLVLVTASLFLLVVPGAVLGFVLPPESPVIPLAQAVLGAPLGVFGVAVVSRAYVQLKEGDGERVEPPTADGDEWNDPPGVDV